MSFYACRYVEFHGVKYAPESRGDIDRKEKKNIDRVFICESADTEDAAIKKLDEGIAGHCRSSDDIMLGCDMYTCMSVGEKSKVEVYENPKLWGMLILWFRQLFD